MDSERFLNGIKGPVKISYEPTIGCNLHCPMCDRTKKAEYINHRDHELPYERKLAFMNEISRSGVRHFLFIGGGEPMMDPHLTEYMRILKSGGVFVHLWTNGTLINEANAPELARLCDMITVSLDSPRAEVNDLSRGVKGATQKTIDGIRLLRKHSGQLYLRIHSVISALNIDHLPAFADFAAENGVNEIAGALMAPFEFVPEAMRFSGDQLRSIGVRIEEVCEYTKRKGVALGCWYENKSAKMIQNLTNLHNMYPVSSPQVTSRAITCLGLWGQATVRPNGDVSVCCFSYKPVLGNLHEQTFEEIWHSKRAEELRKLVLEGNYIDQPCVGCDMGHPVFTRDLELTGNLDSFLEMTVNAR